MKKRNVALAVGLAITMGVSSIALAACNDPETPAGPSPFEDNTKFAAVPVTETTHFLAGKLTYFGGDHWGTDENVSDIDALRFLQHTEMKNLYKLTVSMFETDEFKIRYEGTGWDDDKPKTNIGAQYLAEPQQSDKEGDIINPGGGVGGPNFKVQKDGKYEIWLTMSEDNSACVSVVYKRIGEADSISVGVESVTVTGAKKTIEVGSDLQLTATVSPSNADDDKKVIKWSSSDEKVAKVDNTGKVHAEGKGTAIITAESADGIKGTYNIKVIGVGEAIPAESVVVKDAAGATVTALPGKHAGQKVVLTAEIGPTETTTEEVSWAVVHKDLEDTSDVTGITLEVDEEDPNKVTVVCAKPGDYILTVSADEVNVNIEVNVVMDFYVIGSSKNEHSVGWNLQSDTTVIESDMLLTLQPDGSFKTEGVDLYLGDTVKLLPICGGWDDALAPKNFADREGNINKADEIGGQGEGNIEILKSAKYAITVTPVEDGYKVAFENVGEAAPVEWAYDIYAQGGWDSWRDMIKLNEEGDFDTEHSVTFEKELEADTQFLFVLKDVGGADGKRWIKFADVVNADEYEGVVERAEGDGNILAKVAGTYKFKVEITGTGKINITILEAPEAAE